jgi:hypothetical protein
MNTSTLLAACFLVGAGASPQDSKEVRRLLEPHGVGAFPIHLRVALDAFHEAEELYRKGKYRRCRGVLDELWDRYPPATEEWSWLRSPVPDVFLGGPPCYYSLRMLTEAVDGRLGHEKGAAPPDELRMVVVLVGLSRGLQPRTLAELEAGTGEQVEHTLHPLLLEDESRVVHESLWLFGEYVLAITDGRLALRVEVVHLPELVVPVDSEPTPLRRADLVGGAEREVWEALPRDLLRGTDWWWILYPSHVPEQHPDFAGMEFITGGMGVGPDGSSPGFLIDDLWLVRKPPHLGRGPYSDLERRIYLPQWFQHEFFHHLFRTYTEFGLEEEGHQWFDPGKWPEDFVGSMEPDYFHEALHRRLRAASPPLQASLRYRGPDGDDFGRLTAESLVGTYRRSPVENDWHEGEIDAASKRLGKVKRLRWTNAAGVRWYLTPDLENGRLLTGEDSPYFDSDPVNGRSFEIVLRRGPDGRFVPEVVGFRFKGSLYELTRD